MLLWLPKGNLLNHLVEVFHLGSHSSIIDLYLKFTLTLNSSLLVWTWPSKTFILGAMEENLRPAFQNLDGRPKERLNLCASMLASGPARVITSCSVI